MLVSRDAIINGVTNYIDTEVTRVVTDSNLKFVLTALIAAIEVNPRLADKFFENDLLKTVLKEDHGMYDIDMAEQIIKKTIKECGALTVEVPSIPLILPKPQELRFTAQDVDGMFRMIKGGMHNDDESNI